MFSQLHSVDSFPDLKYFLHICIDQYSAKDPRGTLKISEALSTQHSLFCEVLSSPVLYHMKYSYLALPEFSTVSSTQGDCQDLFELPLLVLWTGNTLQSVTEAIVGLTSFVSFHAAHCLMSQDPV